MTERDYWNPIVETMGPSEQREMQAEKLARQLRYVVERSPFYGQKFDEAGFDTTRFRTMGDLACAPFTHKEELRESQVEHPPLGEHAAAGMEEVLRVHSSTGTTGRPSYVGITRRDREVWTEVVSRVYWCEGLTAVCIRVDPTARIADSRTDPRDSRLPVILPNSLSAQRINLYEHRCRNAENGDRLGLGQPQKTA